MTSGLQEDFRISVDTGGTFTDAVIAQGADIAAIGKAPTTYGGLTDGFYGAIANAAASLGLTTSELFARTGRLVFGTTHAVNAYVQKRTAKTALLVTDGFADMLLFREGGRPADLLFEYNIEYPDPYIPRRHTFEVRERIDAEGNVSTTLDENAIVATLQGIKEQGFAAVAVCLLWSVANPEHELRIGELIEQELPGIPYTLSHQLLRIVREYRRASATAIDASLKPMMEEALGQLEQSLRERGYRGPILVSTSSGGAVPLAHAMEHPVYLLKSGPAMAPVAGRAYAKREDLGGEVIVVDTGGTTFDVGLVQADEILFTRDTWMGDEGLGDLLAMSTVDIRSIGAGGGSIASVDAGGLLSVGPRSAGSEPGPVCYGKGGTEPTVTDAAAVLGYLQPDYFFGGRMQLDVESAHKAITLLGEKLGLTTEQAAAGIVRLANESMIDAINGLTLQVGIDPRSSVLAAGGGAAGLNIVPIARELGVSTVLVPREAGVFSAVGMQFSDLVFRHGTSRLAQSGSFDRAAINGIFDEIHGHLDTFIEQASGTVEATWTKEFRCEARYAGQVWEVEFKTPGDRFDSQGDVDALVAAFHEAHLRQFTFVDDTNEIEFINWIGLVSGAMPSELHQDAEGPLSRELGEPLDVRTAWFEGVASAAPVYQDDALLPGMTVPGPATVVSPTSTLVLYPGSSALVTKSNDFLITIGDSQ